MANQIELGYTLTDCYHMNANYGESQQKQYVVMVDGEIKNIFLKGFVNKPADEGRSRTYHKIVDLSQDKFAELKEISDSHIKIDWNHGRYHVFSNLLTDNQVKELNAAADAYVQKLQEICDPINFRNEAETKGKLATFVSQFESVNASFIWVW